jgi:transmembrane sensor
MDGQKERILILLAKFERGEASEPELDELDKWYHSFEQDVKYTTGLSEAGRLEAKDNLLVRINNRLDQEPAAGEPYRRVRSISLWPRIAIAAILLICLSAGGYFLIQKQAATQQTAQQYDIAPGGNKAILTLANGKKISLTDAKKGELAVQSGIRVSKKADGQLVYTPSDTVSSSSSLSYNTIETPRGGQYHVRLPDGTKVWLNAASSLKYPASFGALKERRVQLNGEAYFEVAHNKAQPFRVQTEKQTVTVLGTHFDVNAYADEPDVRTTLLEGRVSVDAGSNNTIIKPGQQVVLNQSKFQVVPADTEDATAWKNGMFRFSEENLESIMRKVSRWYDVDIEYANNDVKNLPLTGIITHFSNVSKVLRMLELTEQVHFKIEGKKIIVMK